jgi:DNA-binding CsgD family transcriptional regulator
MKGIAEVETGVNKELQFGNLTFVIFQEIEWPSTGGVDMDALPTTPVSIPLSSIRALRPAKTWKTWGNTVEIWTAKDTRIAVRGTLDEVVNKLNGPSDTRKPFALTRREERLHRMREDGYSLSQRALAFNTTALRIAKEEAVIVKKLEFPLHSEALRIAGGRDTLMMMRDKNIHPNATT